MNTLIIESLPPPVQFNIWDYGKLAPPDMPMPETAADIMTQLLDASRELYRANRAVGDLTCNNARLIFAMRCVLAGEDTAVLRVELEKQGVRE
jgi:hypothetical protein